MENKPFAVLEEDFMNLKTIIIMIFSIFLCACANQQDSDYKPASGLDNWGRGQDPWMNDWEREQQAAAKRNEELKKYQK